MGCLPHEAPSLRRACEGVGRCFVSGGKETLRCSSRCVTGGGGGWSAGQEVAVLSDWEKYEAFINEVQGAKAVLFFKQSDERSSVMQKALAALQRVGVGCVGERV